MSAASRERTLSYQRVLRRARDLKVSEEDIAMVVHQLRDGTTPEELEDELLRHVPARTFHEENRLMRELGRNETRPGRRHVLAA